MYKAIFIDLDGTLVNSNGKISENTKQAIKQTTDAGIQVIICSGRQRISARKFKDECSTSKYLISANGAEIYDCDKEQVLFESSIDTQTCVDLCDFAFKKNMVVKLNFGLGRTTNKPYEVEFYEMELKEEETNEFLAKNKITQILFGSENIEDMEKIQEIISEKSDIKIVNRFVWNVQDKHFFSIHVARPNVSKGNSMCGLCKLLKINMEEVVAVGDKWNDVPMIEMAGLGVAMGNSAENVKNKADFVTDTNDEDGVANLIYKILAKNNEELK